MNHETELARLLLDTLFPATQALRVEMRSAASDRLTVAQFRILAQLYRGVKNVARLAEHQGVSQPAMSKMVEGLVVRGLVARTPFAEDRRLISLNLTEAGQAIFQEVREKAQRNMATRLAQLSADQQNQIRQGLALIRQVLVDNQPQT